MAVIYDHNESSQFYKTTITAKARNINYKRELCSKLKRDLQL